MQKKNFSEYDTNDPFIDDSELALDERQFFGQTKQQGFYVSSGEVALVKDKYVPTSLSSTATLLMPKLVRTPKKPKSKKPGPSAKADPAAGPSTLSKGPEDLDSYIALLGSEEEDRDAKTGQKRKRFSYVVENGKKRKIINIQDFHPELQQAIEELKVHIAKGTSILPQKSVSRC